MTDDVVVPEGHEILAFGSSPKPFFTRAQSGVWILNFGNGGDLGGSLGGRIWVAIGREEEG